MESNSPNNTNHDEASMCHRQQQLEITVAKGGWCTREHAGQRFALQAPELMPIKTAWPTQKECSPKWGQQHRLAAGAAAAATPARMKMLRAARLLLPPNKKFESVHVLRLARRTWFLRSAAKGAKTPCITSESLLWALPTSVASSCT
jgi:hypothetical protein